MKNYNKLRYTAVKIEREIIALESCGGPASGAGDRYEVWVTRSHIELFWTAKNGQNYKVNTLRGSPQSLS